MGNCLDMFSQHLSVPKPNLSYSQSENGAFAQFCQERLSPLLDHDLNVSVGIPKLQKIDSSRWANNGEGHGFGENNWLDVSQEETIVPSSFHSPGSIEVEDLQAAKPVVSSSQGLNEMEEQKSTITSVKTLVETGCKCRKSRCLKLYCECLAKGQMCGESCGCTHCYNNPQHETARRKAIQAIKERNALSKFAQENPDKVSELIHNKDMCIQVIQEGLESMQLTDHSLLKEAKGCSCKRSSCQKRYCECFVRGESCTEECSCEGCKNCEPSDGTVRRKQILKNKSFLYRHPRVATH
eukprot:TRINITY_DN14091_c0_g2_i2.p1 TRINITY_DN14091_c0_g2~~TRINITY_DN14091_c0_g2_i2.p1  ORF type:complete len:296 (+),score=30.39 TRINITY_DN14091_c0_g2_i2:89-976(+)